METAAILMFVVSALLLGYQWIRRVLILKPVSYMKKYRRSYLPETFNASVEFRSTFSAQLDESELQEQMRSHLFLLSCTRLSDEAAFFRDVFEIVTGRHWEAGDTYSSNMHGKKLIDLADIDADVERSAGDVQRAETNSTRMNSSIGGSVLDVAHRSTTDAIVRSIHIYWSDHSTTVEMLQRDDVIESLFLGFKPPRGFVWRFASLMKTSLARNSYLNIETKTLRKLSAGFLIFSGATQNKLLIEYERAS